VPQINLSRLVRNDPQMSVKMSSGLKESELITKRQTMHLPTNNKIPEVHNRLRKDQLSCAMTSALRNDKVLIMMIQTYHMHICTIMISEERQVMYYDSMNWHGLTGIQLFGSGAKFVPLIFYHLNSIALDIL
jgi:hypothetical protein